MSINGNPNASARKQGLRLSRQISESIVIETSDGIIQFSVHNFIGSKVVLLFNCPENIKVFRKELYDRLKKSQP